MSTLLRTSGLDQKRRPLRLSWSEAISGAELYDGEDIETFTTGWHFHEGWQFVAVTKGERRYEFKSGTIVARPGHLVLIPPRLVHRAHCVHQDKTNFRIATLPADGLSFKALATPITRVTPKFFDEFIDMFKALRDKTQSESKASVLSHLRAILTESRATHDLAFPVPPSFVIQAEKHLLQSLDRIPSLEFLSSLTGVSRYHLAHTFTKHVGLSPLAFHTRARLMRSRTMISEAWPLADTSFFLRFSDQSHFGRQFKKVYGMTPREYRLSLAS